MNPRQRMYKIAAGTIEMGHPASAGKGIADIIKFVTSRIEPGRRQKSMENLKQKIWRINELEIASKKTPSSASLGQAITFVKTILIGHDPGYIRQVLKYIVWNL